MAAAAASYERVAAAQGIHCASPSTGETQVRKRPFDTCRVVAVGLNQERGVTRTQEKGW